MIQSTHPHCEQFYINFICHYNATFTAGCTDQTKRDALCSRLFEPAVPQGIEDYPIIPSTPAEAFSPTQARQETCAGPPELSQNGKDDCTVPARNASEQTSPRASHDPLWTMQDGGATQSIQRRSVSTQKCRKYQHTVSAILPPQQNTSVLSPSKQEKASVSTSARGSKRQSKSTRINRLAQSASFYSRRSNVRQLTMKEVVDLTDVDKYTSSSTKPVESPPWITSEHVQLQQRHHDIIFDNQWLNDDIIDAAQSLLKLQSGANGFHPICVTRTLTVDIQRDNFIQILHNGYNHWLTVSKIGKQKDGEVAICV